MTRVTAAQQRLLDNATSIAAIRLLFDRMRELYPCPTLREVVTIHNGQALPASHRDEVGLHGVYAAGGLVGHHSASLSTEPFVVIGRKGSAGKPTFAARGGWVIDTAYFAQPNDSKLDTTFLYYALLSLDFADDIISTAIPGINRTAIYRHTIPLPPIATQSAVVRFLDATANHPRELPVLPVALQEQRRIVARIEELAAKIEEARGLRREVADSSHGMLLGVYRKIVKNVQLMHMEHVAPLVRRPVQVKPDAQYYELGIRSFGKGTFHKPPITGHELGSKRIFYIEPDDLLFNIVFAWEGAVAVATPQDRGRVGSHRFLTCVPVDSLATPSFLRFHFLSRQGLEDLGIASPGGAGRNRTLSMKGLANIRVPIPPYDKQLWFDDLQHKVQQAERLREEVGTELDALLPSVLDKAFKGEL